MSDSMSFDKYIDNPSGGASVITNRNMYKNMYKSKFNTVLVREQGRIVYSVYKTNDNNDSYYIHFKIPSEVIPEFYYDVVVRLYTTMNSKKVDTYLRQYAVEFYSNDPAFVYTFAHSFAKNKLFIDDLAPKMVNDALTQKAKVKNPKDDVWYVKSLYFAYLTMERYNLFSRVILDREAKKYNKNELLSKITHAKKKIQDRQDAVSRVEKEKKNQDSKSQKQQSSNVSAHISKKAAIMRTTKHTKTTAQTKRVRSSKTTKKK